MFELEFSAVRNITSSVQVARSDGILPLSSAGAQVAAIETISQEGKAQRTQVVGQSEEQHEPDQSANFHVNLRTNLHTRPAIIQASLARGSTALLVDQTYVYLKDIIQKPRILA